MSMSFTPYLIAVAVATVYGWAFWAMRSPLRSIPGPFWARISPIWLAFHARHGRRYKLVHEAHKKYGPVVRISPKHISLATPEAVQLVYSHGKTSLDKSTYYSSFVSEKASIFATVDRAEHGRKRRILSQAFSLNSIEDSFVPYIQDHLHTLVEQLGDRIKLGNTEQNLLRWMNFLTFDILSDLAFGECIGMLKAGDDLVDIIRADGTPGKANAVSLVDGREHLAAVLGLIPASLRPLARFLPDTFFRRGRECTDGLTDFAREKVLKRLESGVQRDDILGKIIATHEKQGNDIRNDMFQELVGECVTLLIAGSDTTATTSCAVIFYVLNHPDVLRRLMAELEGNLSKNQVPSFQDVKTLPYLYAVVLEGLRFHATMSMGLPRTTSTEGLTVGGYYIPPDTDVSVPAWTAHREFFDDGYSYKPERWLEPSAQEMKGYVLGFGKGPRACLGRHLAETEMVLIVSTIFMNFDVKLLCQNLQSEEGFVHKVIKMPVQLSSRVA